MPFSFSRLILALSGRKSCETNFFFVDVRTMNNIEEIEIDLATEQKPANSPHKRTGSTHHGAVHRGSKNHGTVNNRIVNTQIIINEPARVYRQNQTIELVDKEPLEKKSALKPLFGRFHFRREPDFPRSIAAVDLLLTILCFGWVHVVYLNNLNLSSQRSIALFSALFLISTSLYVTGMYHPRKLRSLAQELTTLSLCWIFSFTALGLFTFLTKTAGDISRIWITASMVLTLILLIGIRLFSSMGIVARSNSEARNIVLVGDSKNTKPVMSDLQKLSNSNIRLAKVFDISRHQTGAAGSMASVSTRNSLKNTASQISKYVELQRQTGAVIEQVWIAASENQAEIFEQISEPLFDSPVDVCIVPDLYTERLLRGEVTRYGTTHLINVSEISLSMAADQFKRVFDVIIATIALALFCIPMVIIAGLLKLESKGPVLFRQKRYGVDGREIEIFKFRSMFLHSDSQVQQASRNDARVTRVGKIIRKTSMDELPQLLNVLNGSMSLVGPRPHAVAHNEIWRTRIQGYMLRHKVRPGITGWAQVNGWRGETDTPFKMQQRVKYDLEYIRNWSPWLDIKILFLTVFVGFLHRNAY